MTRSDKLRPLYGYVPRGLDGGDGETGDTSAALCRRGTGVTEKRPVGDVFSPLRPKEKTSSLLLWLKEKPYTALHLKVWSG